MKQPGTKLALETALFLILFAFAVPVRAHALDVCNKGTVPVVVVTTMKNADLARGLGKYYWAITSTAIGSGNCKTVYSDMFGDGAYLGFGFEDAKGQWGSGKAAHVPDFGKYTHWFQTWPILSRGEGTISACAPKVDSTYTFEDDPKTDCATLRLIPSHGAQEVRGPFLPITSALYFKATDIECLHDNGVVGFCQYYLNVSPSAADRELHAATGTDSGAEDAKGNGGDSLGTQLLKAAAKAAAEENQKQARRQAQVAAAAPPGGFTRFKDGCNAFYRDPANARLSMSDATGWCACLSEQYRNLMTPEEESKYANDFARLFHGGIAQPLGFGLSKSDPAWPRLHPAVDRCVR